MPTPAESSELLATKLSYVLEQGLKCVLAIGEPLPIREQGVDAVLEHCAKQLQVPSQRPASVFISPE